MLRLVVPFLFALSLAAQTQSIVLDPPGPTSASPIVADLYVTCDPLSYTVDRVGNVIKINVTQGPLEPICDPPIASLLRVPIGALPVGEYRMDVTVGALDSVAASRTFVVRNAAQSVIDIHPFTVPVQPFGLKLRLTAGELAVAKIFVDDVQVPPASITYDGAYWFAAPEHARGLVDVKVETDTGATHILPGALYYYDGTESFDRSVFERILFPVLFSTDGAHGSRWVSEAAIANPQSWFIETYNAVMPFECITYPCGERLSPESYAAFNGAGYPNGVALIVPRAETDNLVFSLRVRDTSRDAEGYGTQVPVVREDEMFRGTDLTLLDIPMDPLYRVKLRIYAFDTGSQDAEVTVHRQSAPNAVAARYFVPMGRQCNEPCEGAPWYGELDLQYPEAQEHVNVYVSIGSHGAPPAWAFASITNNETQQVTIVTADGAGGRP